MERKENKFICENLDICIDLAKIYFLNPKFEVVVSILHNMSAFPVGVIPDSTSLSLRKYNGRKMLKT